MSGPPRFWTNERILSALHDWVAEHGRTPGQHQWLHATPTTPSVTTVRERFGGWNAMIVAAGFEARTTRIEWTRERTIAAAHSWAARNGHSPRAADWAAPTQGAPSYATVYYHFGGWPEFLSAASLPSPPRGRRWTRDRIAEAMLEFLIREGRWPRDDDWAVAANGEDRPSHMTVKRAFGSWTKAKRYAGWPGRCWNCNEPLGRSARSSQRWCSLPCRREARKARANKFVSGRSPASLARAATDGAVAAPVGDVPSHINEKVAA